LPRGRCRCVWRGCLTWDEANPSIVLVRSDAQIGLEEEEDNEEEEDCGKTVIHITIR
jgi:hypothetical protein